MYSDGDKTGHEIVLGKDIISKSVPGPEYQFRALIGKENAQLTMIGSGRASTRNDSGCLCMTCLSLNAAFVFV